jgi:hypothetical protein
MKKDKDKVISFFNMKGIDARQISKKKPGKTPDLELYIDDSQFGVCEIKSIVDYKFFGERADPTFNKIEKKIHEASKQFSAYNANQKVPNILLFMNHYKNIGFKDFWVVLTGQETPPNIPSEPIDIRYLKRLIQRNDLENIDYYIWIDDKKSLASYTVAESSLFKKVLKDKISSKAYEYLQNNGS